MNRRWLAMFLVLCLMMPLMAWGEGEEELTVVITLDKSSVAVNEPITATIEISGGTAPYSVFASFMLSEKGHYYGQNDVDADSEGKYVFTPIYGDQGEFYCSIEDSSGGEEGYLEKSVPFTITGAADIEPFVLKMNLDKDAVNANLDEPITATWEVTGGSKLVYVSIQWGMFDSKYNFLDGTHEEYTERKGSETFIPFKGVHGSCWMQAGDEMGRWISEQYDFTITGESFHVLMNLEKESVPAYQKQLATAEPKLGEAPFTYAFEWKVFDEVAGKWIQFYTQAESEKNTSEAEMPKVEGWAVVTVTAKDARGQVRKHVEGFPVTDVDYVRGDATGDGKVETEDLAALTEHWFKGLEDARAVENAIADPEKGVQISDLLAVIALIVGD